MSSFYDWKNNPITIVVMEEYRRRLENAKTQLASSAGLDPALDRWTCGAIQAYQDILDIRPEELEEPLND